MKPYFHLFVYGTLRDGARDVPPGVAGAPDTSAVMAGAERVGSGNVEGTLYDIRGEYPALLLGGEGRVRGEIWRCPVDRLGALDRHEGVAAGLFRRVAVRVSGQACWTYVAGPRLGEWLSPGTRIASGDWLLEAGEPAG
ncbi:MAG TPA: gamma-glutamylcyclotransferase family protein [Longimicrobiales bacterium]|nr:gamma-glutamylcyclotransferase family protein [Longimicrobiales bacterium]